jgi:hypothetical protein
MKTRTDQFDKQHSEETSEQQKMGSLCGLGLESIQTPIITRRAFFAAMVAVLAEEFRKGRNRRQSSSSA